MTADISGDGLRPASRFAIRSEQHQAGKKDVWYVNDYTLTPDGAGTHLSKPVTSNRHPAISSSPTRRSAPTR